MIHKDSHDAVSFTGFSESGTGFRRVGFSCLTVFLFFRCVLCVCVCVRVFHFRVHRSIYYEICFSWVTSPPFADFPDVVLTEINRIRAHDCLQLLSFFLPTFSATLSCHFPWQRTLFHRFVALDSFLLVFTALYWVFTGFYCFFMGFTGFYLLTWKFTAFCWGFT